MCTLTYVFSKNHIIITSNRDEHIRRGTSKFPVYATRENQKITFPQDPEAGGSWIATTNNLRTTVLLNGAFEKHKHQPPYRKSRGIILLDSLNFTNLEAFQNLYDLNQIEPFTLVNFDIHHKIIEEIRWDGKSTFYQTYNFEANHIWSSATLYTPETIDIRKTLFANWTNNKGTRKEDLIRFHEFNDKGNTYNNIKMERTGELQTVSISQISIQNAQVDFSHKNLLTYEVKAVSIPQKTS